MGKHTVLDSPLYANSAYLLLNQVTNYLLGFLFWIVVARLYTTEELGIGSALTSGGALLSFIATLGLGTGLIRYLPHFRASATALINFYFTISALLAFVVAVVFIAGIPLWSAGLRLVRENMVFSGIFVAFVVIGTLYNLLGDTYVGLRRAEFSLLQGFIMGMTKLVLVVVLANILHVIGILGSWTLATSATVGLGIFLFMERIQPGYRPLPTLRKHGSKEMMYFSFANYVGAGLWSVPGWLLPVIVVSKMGGQSSGYFFVSWAMAGVLFAIPTSISTSLFAQGSHGDTSMVRDSSKSLKLTTALVLPALALFEVVGDKLLLIFGRRYSLEGAGLLRIIAPSVLPLSVNVLYLAIAKVRKSLKDVILLAAGPAVGTLAFSFVLIPHLGIQGPAVAWLVSQTLVALVVLPRLIKVLKSTEDRVYEEKE